MARLQSLLDKAALLPMAPFFFLQDILALGLLLIRNQWIHWKLNDPKVKILWFMRHGSLPMDYDGRLVGRVDLPLSKTGREEAISAAGFFTSLPPFDLILCSPALRARQTMELALSPTDAAKASIEQDLNETDFGEWEGLSIGQIGERFPTQLQAWSADNPDFTFPGGESMKHFNLRVAKMRELLEASTAERILVFSHGGMILGLLCAFLGLPRSKMVAFKLDRGALCRIDVYHGNSGALVNLNLKPGAQSRWLK